MFFLFFWLAAVRILFFDKARGAIWLAASFCCGGQGGGCSRRPRLPVGGVLCAGACALAAGAPVGQVALRMVLAEAWGYAVAALLGLWPSRRRKASLELLGLWGGLVSLGLAFRS